MSSTTNSVALYRRLLGYTRPYWRLGFISLLGYLLFAGMESVMAHLMKYFINGLESRDKQMIIFVPLAIVGARIVHGIGSFFGNYYIARVGLGVVNDLRKELFGQLLYLPSRYYDANNSGELISLITYNIQQVSGSVTQAIKTAMRDGFTVLGLLAYLLYTDWKLTLILIVIAPILAGLVRLASRYFRGLSRRLQVTMGGISHIANEAIQGFRLVRSFGGQRYEKQRFDQTSDQSNKLSTKYERIAALQGPVFDLVVAIDLAILLFLILTFWEEDTGTAVAYLTAAAMIAKPLRQVSTVNETIQRGLAAAETIFAVADMAPENDSGREILEVKQGRIEIENLSFSYDEEHPALRNINLVIEPGQTVALVGRSGSGKSTLTNLLLRLYEFQQGSIRIDGHDIRTQTLASLRGNIALVNQQTILFNDTVLRNIAYGADPAEVTPAQVERSADLACATDFIAALPEGLNTLIGEDGTRLSGGQRQRIAIARALFKNAPILVLDEATSALDNESEKAIQTALNNLQLNRTTLIVAHRLSTIEHADNIVVMDQGRIVEQGTHQQLLAQKGYYASLHAVQSSEDA